MEPRVALVPLCAFVLTALAAGSVHVTHEKPTKTATRRLVRDTAAAGAFVSAVAYVLLGRRRSERSSERGH